MLAVLDTSFPWIYGGDWNFVEMRTRRQARGYEVLPQRGGHMAGGKGHGVGGGRPLGPQAEMHHQVIL